MIFLMTIIFLLGAFMFIMSDNGKMIIIGAIFMVLGLFLFLIYIKPIETEVGAVVTNTYDYPIAGVTKELSVKLPTDYHYEYPAVELEDVDLLARLITAEMGYNAGEDAYYYTASVVWNRMNSDSFPDELREVIYQHTGDRYQYQCVKDGHIERDYDDLAWEVAVAILENGTWIPENVVYQAEFEQGHGVWEQVGRTYFCYE